MFPNPLILPTRDPELLLNDHEWVDCTHTFDSIAQNLEPQDIHSVDFFDGDYAMTALLLGSDVMDAHVNPAEGLTLALARQRKLLMPLRFSFEAIDKSNAETTCHLSKDNFSLLAEPGHTTNEWDDTEIASRILQIMDGILMKSVEFLSGWNSRLTTLGSCIALHDRAFLDASSPILKDYIDGWLLVSEMSSRLMKLTGTLGEAEFNFDCRSQVSRNCRERDLEKGSNFRFDQLNNSSSPNKMRSQCVSPDKMKCVDVDFESYGNQINLSSMKNVVLSPLDDRNWDFQNIKTNMLAHMQTLNLQSRQLSNRKTNAFPDEPENVSHENYKLDNDGPWFIYSVFVRLDFMSNLADFFHHLLRLYDGNPSDLESALRSLHLCFRVLPLIFKTSSLCQKSSSKSSNSAVDINRYLDTSSSLVNQIMGMPINSNRYENSANEQSPSKSSGRVPSIYFDDRLTRRMIVLHPPISSQAATPQQFEGAITNLINFVSFLFYLLPTEYSFRKSYSHQNLLSHVLLLFATTSSVAPSDDAILTTTTTTTTSTKTTFPFKISKTNQVVGCSEISQNRHNDCHSLKNKHNEVTGRSWHGVSSLAAAFGSLVLLTSTFHHCINIISNHSVESSDLIDRSELIQILTKPLAGDEIIDNCIIHDGRDCINRMIRFISEFTEAETLKLAKSTNDQIDFFNEWCERVMQKRLYCFLNKLESFVCPPNNQRLLEVTKNLLSQSDIMSQFLTCFNLHENELPPLETPTWPLSQCILSQHTAIIHISGGCRLEYFGRIFGYLLKIHTNLLQHSSYEENANFDSSWDNEQSKGFKNFFNDFSISNTSGQRSLLQFHSKHHRSRIKSIEFQKVWTLPSQLEKTLSWIQLDCLESLDEYLIHTGIIETALFSSNLYSVVLFFKLSISFLKFFFASKLDFPSRICKQFLFVALWEYSFMGRQFQQNVKATSCREIPNLSDSSESPNRDAIVGLWRVQILPECLKSMGQIPMMLRGIEDSINLVFSQSKCRQCISVTKHLNGSINFQFDEAEMFLKSLIDLEDQKTANVISFLIPYLPKLPSINSDSKMQWVPYYGIPIPS